VDDDFPNFPFAGVFIKDRSLVGIFSIETLKIANVHQKADPGDQPHAGTAQSLFQHSGA